MQRGDAPLHNPPVDWFSAERLAGTANGQPDDRMFASMASRRSSRTLDSRQPEPPCTADASPAFQVFLFFQFLPFTC
jgi:hypothetical protein